MDFRGIYPALMSTFGKDGSFDFTALARLVGRLAGKGVRGFYIGGSSSELFALSIDERKRIMEVVRDGAGSRCAVIAHVGAMSAADAKDLALHAKQTGCDAVSAIPPFYGKYSWEETAAYYRSLRDASGLPMFLYNIPAFTGVSLSVRGYREMAAGGGIAGVKHTSYNLFEMERLKAANPDGIVLAGYDETVCGALAMGAEGVIGTAVNVFPEYFLRIDKYVRTNNLAAARATQSAMNALLEVFMEIGYFPSAKHLLRFTGIDAGDCRPPVLPITREQKTRLEKAYGECEAAMAVIDQAHS